MDLVLIVLIYFPLGPVSAIRNGVLNSTVVNATPRIKTFENFSHSLNAAASTTTPPLSVYICSDFKSYFLGPFLQFCNF
jgi:hypothetical protein